MTTPSTAEIVSRIKKPFPVILQFLAELSKQTNIAFQETPFIYRTTTGRVNYKPFIIGFIPPDDPIDFVPISRTFAKPTIAYNETAKQRGRRGGGTKKGGEQPITPRSVCATKLREVMRREIIKQTGAAPSERSLALMNVHIWVENGKAFDPNHPEKYDCFGTRNYNLGQSHVGGDGKFRDWARVRVVDPSFVGPLPEEAEWTETDLVELHTLRGREGANKIYKILKDNSWNWQLIIEKWPNSGKKPETSAYLAVDTKAGVPYPVYFHSFDSLDEAVAYQVGLLARRYPGALTAQTAEQYVQALQHPPPTIGKDGKSYNFKYFDETIEKSYTAGLELRLEEYKAKFGLPDYEPGDTATLMNYGVSSDYESHDPLAERLGRNIAVADEERVRIAGIQTDALKKQIEIVKAMPPLILLINPREFRRSYEQSVDYGIKGREGHIVHTWLEKPLKISGSGATAAQFAMEADGAGGLTGANRIYSLSYQNLMSMAMIYKNNGLLFGSYAGGENGAGSDLGIPIIAMSVFIYYDNHIYIGSFDDMSINDDASKPHNFEYSFRFNVRYDLPIDGVNLDIDMSINENIQALGF